MLVGMSGQLNSMGVINHFANREPLNLVSYFAHPEPVLPALMCGLVVAMDALVGSAPCDQPPRFGCHSWLQRWARSW